MEQSRRNQEKTELQRAASALVLLVCLFGNLGAIGLTGPDEPRYVWIARAMAQTGDWVTPRLYGQPWFEKPVLYYWLAAIGFRLHLPAEWAARLPSAFAALAAAVAIGWLASRHYGMDLRWTAPAMLAPLIFATTAGGIGFARAATPDMLFSAFITLAMASAGAVLGKKDLAGETRGPGSSRSDALPLVLFGGFLGFAVLAKGPAAIILAGGALILWTAATKQWLNILRFFHPYALASFCVVALPWYVLCAVRNPDFLHVFIFEHNFERYLTPMFQHPQPFWFFIPITLLALLPWTVALWPAAQRGLSLWREKSWRTSLGLFVACWAFFPILFFSFSDSKLPSYILPAVPALALLCAMTIVRIMKFEPLENLRRNTGLGIAGTWLVLGIAALIWMRRLAAAEHDALGNSIYAAAIVAIAGGILAAIFAIRDRSKFVGLSIGLTGLLVVIAGTGVLPRLDPFISARWHAQLLRNDRHPDRIFTYHLPRAWEYGLDFYLGRELPEWSASDPNPALVLTTPRGFAEIRRLHRFYGELDENYRGILYVPIPPLPRQAAPNSLPR